MKWQKIIDDNFLNTGARTGCHAEVVGDKIYIGHLYFDEFSIYDPCKHHFFRLKVTLTSHQSAFKI